MKSFIKQTLSFIHLLSPRTVSDLAYLTHLIDLRSTDFCLKSRCTIPSRSRDASEGQPASDPVLESSSPTAWNPVQAFPSVDMLGLWTVELMER